MGRIKFHLGQIKKRAVQKVLSCIEALRIIKNNPKNNTVLLIEANNSHTELLPSFIKFLNDLHFNVEIITRIEQKNFLPPSNADKIYYCNIPGIKNILKLKKIKEYSFIIFTSYRLYYPTPDKSSLQSTVFDHFNIKHLPKYGTAHVLHHIEDYDKESKNGAIVLSRILKKNDSLYVVNPCYFKENKPKNKNKKITFIITGKLEGSRKSSSLLFDAVQKLIEKNIKNFEINIVGDNSNDCIPCNLKDFINIKGKLGFEELYKELEKSDFYLPLLDPNLKEHLRYITTGTSGSFQLIRGFLLPPLINNVFSIPHGFNFENSIIYDKNDDFHLAMQKAIEISDEEYLTLQNNLYVQREEILKSSVQNLKNLLDNLKEFYLATKD